MGANKKPVFLDSDGLREKLAQSTPVQNTINRPQNKTSRLKLSVKSKIRNISENITRFDADKLLGKKQHGSKKKIEDKKPVLRKTTLSNLQYLRNLSGEKARIRTKPIPRDLSAPFSAKKTISSIPLPKKSDKKLKIRQFLTTRRAKYFIAAIMVLVFAGVLIGYASRNKSKQGTSPVIDKPLVQEKAKSEKPKQQDVALDESNAPSVKDYKVDKDLPRRLTIIKIGLDTVIQKQSATADGQVTVPTNINTVGWYDGSDKPGDKGAMLLMGQISGPTKDGVFKKLDKLAPGDLITIEKGDGSVYYYSVVSTQKYNNSEIDSKKLLSPINPSKSGVNLMTFSGQLDPTNKDYNGRLVVFAEAL